MRGDALSWRRRDHGLLPMRRRWICFADGISYRAARGRFAHVGPQRFPELVPIAVQGWQTSLINCHTAPEYGLQHCAKFAPWQAQLHLALR